MTNDHQKTIIRPSDRSTEVVPWGPGKAIINKASHPDAQLTILETIVLPDHSHAWHVHPDSDEVLFVISGEGYATVGEGNRFAIQQGDYVYIPRGTFHDTHNKSWAPLHLLVMYGPQLPLEPADQQRPYRREELDPEVPLHWDMSFEPGSKEFQTS